MSNVDAKLDAALARYLQARRARGEGDGTKEEFQAWIVKQDLFDEEDRLAIMAIFWDEVWDEYTRAALGLEEYDDDDEAKRLVIQVGGKPIKLPLYIVNPGETEDFADSAHFAPPRASVRHHRLHADWMLRLGSIDAGREQLAVNAELLRRAGGDQDAQIGRLIG